jgi:hypothetical protein
MVADERATAPTPGDGGCGGEEGCSVAAISSAEVTRFVHTVHNQKGFDFFCSK